MRSPRCPSGSERVLLRLRRQASFNLLRSLAGIEAGELVEAAFFEIGQSVEPWEPVEDHSREYDFCISTSRRCVVGLSKCSRAGVGYMLKESQDLRRSPGVLMKECIVYGLDDGMEEVSRQ